MKLRNGFTTVANLVPGTVLCMVFCNLHACIQLGAPLPLHFCAVFRWQLVPIKHHNGNDTMVKQHPDSGHAELDKPAWKVDIWTLVSHSTVHMIEAGHTHLSVGIFSHNSLEHEYAPL